MDDIPSEKMDKVDKIAIENPVKKHNVFVSIHMNKNDESFLNFSQYKSYELKMMSRLKSKHGPS